MDRREFVSLAGRVLVGIPWVLPRSDVLELLGDLSPGPEADTRAQEDGEDLVAGPRGPGRLFLTFDDGPVACTSMILDRLAQGKHLATFFVIGRQLADRNLRKLAIRAVVEGHELGNHSYSHPSFSRLSTRRAEQEIVKTHAQIQGVLREAGAANAEPASYFRFPYGDPGSSATYASVRTLLGKLGYRIAWWDVDTKDWRMRSRQGSRAESRVLGSLKRARSKDIVLFHDRNPTARILPSAFSILFSKSLVSLPLSKYGAGEVIGKPLRDRGTPSEYFSSEEVMGAEPADSLEIPDLEPSFTFEEPDTF